MRILRRVFVLASCVVAVLLAGIAVVAASLVDRGCGAALTVFLLAILTFALTARPFVDTVLVPSAGSVLALAGPRVADFYGFVHSLAVAVLLWLVAVFSAAPRPRLVVRPMLAGVVLFVLFAPLPGATDVSRPVGSLLFASQPPTWGELGVTAGDVVASGPVGFWRSSR